MKFPIAIIMLLAPLRANIAFSDTTADDFQALLQVSEIPSHVGTKFDSCAFDLSDARMGTAVPVRLLIEKGPTATAELWRHLGDLRSTAIELQASGDLEYVGQLDDGSDACAQLGCPESYSPGQSQRLCVGDLCYYILGQIWNRECFPLSGSKYRRRVDEGSRRLDLIYVMGRSIPDVSVSGHRSSLVHDALYSWSSRRVIGALQRLKFYYPATFREVVAKIRSRRAFPMVKTLEYLSFLKTYPGNSITSTRTEIRRFCVASEMDYIFVSSQISEACVSLNRGDLAQIFDVNARKGLVPKEPAILDTNVATWILKNAAGLSDYDLRSRVVASENFLTPDLGTQEERMRWKKLWLKQ